MSFNAAVYHRFNAPVYRRAEDSAATGAFQNMGAGTAADRKQPFIKVVFRETALQDNIFWPGGAESQRAINSTSEVVDDKILGVLGNVPQGIQVFGNTGSTGVKKIFLPGQEIAQQLIDMGFAGGRERTGIMLPLNPSSIRTSYGRASGGATMGTSYVNQGRLRDPYTGYPIPVEPAIGQSTGSITFKGTLGVVEKEEMLMILREIATIQAVWWTNSVSQTTLPSVFNNALQQINNSPFNQAIANTLKINEDKIQAGVREKSSENIAAETARQAVSGWQNIVEKGGKAYSEGLDYFVNYLNNVNLGAGIVTGFSNLVPTTGSPLFKRLGVLGSVPIRWRIEVYSMDTLVIPEKDDSKHRPLLYGGEVNLDDSSVQNFFSSLKNLPPELQQSLNNIPVFGNAIQSLLGSGLVSSGGVAASSTINGIIKTLMDNKNVKEVLDFANNGVDFSPYLLNNTKTQNAVSNLPRTSKPFFYYGRVSELSFNQSAENPHDIGYNLTVTLDNFTSFSNPFSKNHRAGI